jgi:protein TonB
MTRLDTTTWGVAVLLSLLLHSMMFMQSGAKVGADNAPVLQAPLVTRLSFNRAVDKPVLDKPGPVKKQKTEHTKKIETEPVRAKQKVQQTEPVENIEPVRQPVTLPQVRGQQVTQSSDGLLQRERQQYLHALMSHIETFKYYPRAARRRYTEGEVKISFVLRDDGYYEQLMLEGGQSVLVKATQEALESAVPFPLPPDDIGLSGQIEFTMEYSLTD